MLKARSAMPTKTLLAPAKVNLFLRVLGRRDDGYHDLESLVVPISLGDRLEIHAASDPDEFRTLSLSLEVTGDPDQVRGVPVDESNLVLRAAKALADRATVRGFADINLEKRIPAAGGLGGGSSDAAATLRVLNALWGAGLEEEDLLGVAAEIGSDVPAMLTGGVVLIEGRGERVTDLPASRFTGVVATFDFGVSTREAYHWWDSDGGLTGPQGEPMLDSLTGPIEHLAPLLFNDLEGPVIQRHPRIGLVKDVILQGGAAGAVMTGSGPTVFGLLEEGKGLDPEAQRNAEELSGRKVIIVSSAV
jgi:4-diphosphocytidyl-2-C-methyl-D-erythritol kinase